MRIYLLYLFIWVLITFSFSGYSQNLLNNPGFEGTYTTVAPSWSFLAQGSPAPVIVYSRDTVDVHGGLSCQRISVTGLDTGNQYFFAQPFTFQRGHIYTGSIWLRSSGADTVSLGYRRSAPYYDFPTSKTIAVDTIWQQVTVCGGFADSFDVSGTFNIYFQSNGTIYLDDASLTDVTDSMLNLPVSDITTAIPDHFFGLHLNKWQGTTDTIWPALQQGMIRLWDSGLKWSDIEPSRGNFVWTKFDKYINDALGYDSTVSFVYTMGITPFWAASNPHSDTVEFTGSPSPPSDINDWITYIDSVATRYKGKIKYWETWNEVSNEGTSAFYTGTIPEMIALTQAAHQELKSIDSSNILIGPNNTVGGIPWMDQFLFQGGGQYFDYLSFHLYPDVAIEDDIPILVAIKNLLQNYGMGNTTIFNTEGAVNIGYPDTLQSEGSVSRIFLVQWAFGISDFNWYCWDISKPSGISLAVNPLDTNRTPAGVAYQQTAAWLQGASMTYKSADTATHTWLIEIQRPGGYMGYILWRQDWSTGTYSIPSSWNIATERTLTGDSINIAGSTSVTITGNPILLESGITTGLKDISLASGISIYPNPFTSSTTISFNDAGTHTIEIDDIAGREINTVICTGSLYELSGAQLSPGLYIVRTSDGAGQYYYSKIEVE